MARVGRNRPCPCGSGRKYKKCCGDTAQRAPTSAPRDAAWPSFDGAYFRFRVTLGVEAPPVWRRFLLRRDASFADLHAAIQALGWDDCHCWEFTDSSGKALAARPGGGGSFAPVDAMFAGLFAGGGPAPAADTVPLAGFFRRAGDSCVYTYDFGDRWEHDVQLLAIEHRKADFHRALLAGAGRFPPEDCGGVPGWARLVEFHRTGNDPWGDPESLAHWLEQDPFAPFDFDRARRSFGAILDDVRDARDSSARCDRIDEAIVDTLTGLVRQSLAGFARDSGLDVRIRRANYNALNARFEIEVATVRDDGIVMGKEAEDFLVRCGEVGLGPADLGAEFAAGPERFRIVGLRPRAKAPVLCEQLWPPGEALVRFGAKTLGNLLGRRGSGGEQTTPHAPPREDREHGEQAAAEG